MGLKKLTIKQLGRVSPARFTAMQSCLLREIWTASGNEPLLPPSPMAELGIVIHRLLEAAGHGQLDGGGNEKIEATWDELISQVEKKMTLSALRRHQVPLSRIIPDFEVRKIRSCRRAAEIAHNVLRAQNEGTRQALEPTGFELWVESDDGRVGGYIDFVRMTRAGVVLSDYKTGAVLQSGTDESCGQIKRAYKVQLKLYAALYRLKCGVWPSRLEVVPLQGPPVKVIFVPEDAELLLAEASSFLQFVNKRIAQVKNGSANVTDLASPKAVNCRHCLFRPACQAYWIAKRKESQQKWPYDVEGFLKDMRRLRNGKVCMMLAEDDLSTSNYITVRNLTDCTQRHPLLNRIPKGGRLAIYGLMYHCRSDDYTETQNTVIYETE
ncbi:MAG: PD-(D/E)XK nuclease family protein [Deltaproteobacteria bacterium]|nr:PD-(D/E)XK nuclease family protein [Deltaproteobacteria bacterium]